ncbi:hypothetical protein IEQ34_022613 [Dendrobium chrysotoxum]|uniref:Uncharacterized protein n=1 Tax=Dendrobium chrysotoxum TaxID=161865 RepID=A0AAV7FZD1_DENCH|nr:hypothetical protein IEQ34_022613 [Dendrobium chrysotoxum]
MVAFMGSFQPMDQSEVLKLEDPGEEEELEDVFVLTDEWREFFAKSEAKRRMGIIDGSPLESISTKDREPLKPTQDRVQIVLDDSCIVLDDPVKTETLIRATKSRRSD